MLVALLLALQPGSSFAAPIAVIKESPAYPSRFKRLSRADLSGDGPQSEGAQKRSKDAVAFLQEGKIADLKNQTLLVALTHSPTQSELYLKVSLGKKSDESGKTVDVVTLTGVEVQPPLGRNHIRQEKTLTAHQIPIDLQKLWTDSEVQQSMTALFIAVLQDLGMKANEKNDASVERQEVPRPMTVLLKVLADAKELKSQTTVAVSYKTEGVSGQQHSVLQHFPYFSTAQTGEKAEKIQLDHIVLGPAALIDQYWQARSRGSIASLENAQDVQNWAKRENQALQQQLMQHADEVANALLSQDAARIQSIAELIYDLLSKNYEMQELGIGLTAETLKNALMASALLVQQNGLQKGQIVAALGGISQAISPAEDWKTYQTRSGQVVLVHNSSVADAVGGKKLPASVRNALQADGMRISTSLRTGSEKPLRTLTMRPSSMTGHKRGQKHR